MPGTPRACDQPVNKIDKNAHPNEAYILEAGDQQKTEL